MEEEGKKIETSVKKKRKKAKITVITLSTVLVMFLGLQVYASTNGYGNAFFMIRNLITTGNPAGNDEIFSDRDITLSYKSIELADGLKIQANRLEIRDGKTKLYLAVKSQKTEQLPLNYEIFIKSNEGMQITTKTNITGVKPDNSENVSYEDIVTINNEINEDQIIVLKISDSNGKELRTLEINLQTREITVKGEKEFEKISQIELKKYLDLFSELNNGTEKSDVLVYIAQKIENNYDSFMEKEDYDEAKKYFTDRAFKNAIIKEFYGENAEFEYKKQANTNNPDVEVLKGITGWEFDKANDAYKPLTAGEEYKHGKCLKIEDISYENDIYTVKYVYLLATGHNEEDDKLEELPQYETTIKLKRDDDQLYSKYQIVSIESGKEITQKVNTEVEDENTENDVWSDFSEVSIDESKLEYMDNFTHPLNGMIAISKMGENEFKTVQKNGYYTYTDMFNNSYNIKKIGVIDSEFIMTNMYNNAALFRCTIHYTDNNNQEKSFDVALILERDFSNATIMGNYDSYTGSTLFRRFAGLGTDEEANTNNNQTNTNNSTNTTDNRTYSREELMDTNNWVEYWPDIGMKLKLPKNFEQGQVNEERGIISVNMSGWIVLPILHYEREQDPKYEGVPVRIELYTEIHDNNVNIWDVLEDSQDRVVKSTDNRNWSDWYPLKDDSVPTITPNGYIRRSYGRVRGSMIEKVIFDMQTEHGMDTTHYNFISNVLETVSSTSR